MNKKLSALKVCLTVSTVLCCNEATNARVSGFYVGVSGAASITRFKIYDGTKHVTKNGSLTVNTGTYYDLPNGVLAQTSAPVKVEIESKSVLAGNDDFAITPHVFSVRPAVSVFVGFGRQVAGNLILGGEFNLGLVLGSHKFNGGALAPDLTEYTTEDGTHNVIVKKSDYYKSKNFQTNFELKTKFDVGAALRIGTIIPGTDGRFAAYLKFMVGLARQEIKVGQVGTGEFYYKAITDSLIKSAKSHFLKATDAYTAAAAAVANAAAAAAAPGGPAVPAAVVQAQTAAIDQYIAFAIARDVFYNTYARKGVDAGNNAPTVSQALLQNVRNSGGTLAAADLTNLTAAYAAPIAAFMTTGAELVEGAKSNIQDPSLSLCKNVLRLGFGIEGEWQFASGMFFRFGAMLSRATGFFASDQVTVKSATRKAITDDVGKAADAGTFASFITGTPVYIPELQQYTSCFAGDVVQPAVAGGAPAALVGLANLTPAHTAAVIQQINSSIKAVLISGFSSLPENGIDVGSLERRIGTGKSTWDLSVTVGVGFRF
ncbi:MAG: hypothetical protein LBD36_02945 [Holosporales bacterium]|jgi:hypothetical protein|nr:hypothetical protein [Holosporales bacterium]